MERINLVNELSQANASSRDFSRMKTDIDFSMLRSNTI